MCSNNYYKCNYCHYLSNNNKLIISCNSNNINCKNKICYDNCQISKLKENAKYSKNNWVNCNSSNITHNLHFKNETISIQKLICPDCKIKEQCQICNKIVCNKCSCDCVIINHWIDMFYNITGFPIICLVISIVILSYSNNWT